jgi:hypothetical protein
MDSLINNDMRTGEKRNAIRLDCDYKCLLQHNGIMYPFEIKNISTSGVLLDASFIIPVNIHLGETCNLLFGSHHTMSPLHCKSKITRLEDSKIALQFLDTAF